MNKPMVTKPAEFIQTSLDEQSVPVRTRISSLTTSADDDERAANNLRLRASTLRDERRLILAKAAEQYRAQTRLGSDTEAAGKEATATANQQIDEVNSRCDKAVKRLNDDILEIKSQAAVEIANIRVRVQAVVTESTTTAQRIYQEAKEEKLTNEQIAEQYAQQADEAEREAKRLTDITAVKRIQVNRNEIKLSILKVMHNTREYCHSEMFFHAQRRAQSMKFFFTTALLSVAMEVVSVLYLTLKFGSSEKTLTGAIAYGLIFNAMLVPIALFTLSYLRAEQKDASAQLDRRSAEIAQGGTLQAMYSEALDSGSEKRIDAALDSWLVFQGSVKAPKDDKAIESDAVVFSKLVSEQKLLSLPSGANSSKDKN